jgi:hypothetical protein
MRNFLAGLISRCRLAARPVACQTSLMVRGPRQTIHPAIKAWNVWKTSARKQSRNGAISPARLGISWSMGADLRAATILVGLSNPRISRRHGKVRSLLLHR